MPDDNIIHFKPRPDKRDEPPKRKHPPMFNIPLATKILSGLLIAIYLVIWGLGQTFAPHSEEIAVYYGGFVPAQWTGAAPFFWWTPFSILLFSFLHAGWLHLGVNIMMLVSIGSGLEKSVGIPKYLFIYFAGTLFAALTHLAFSPFSETAVIGASGGVSALFGAMLYLMKKQQAAIMSERGNTILPIVIVWIAISAIGGFLGAPNGSPVAWIAHIGGFLSGIGLMMMLLKRRT